MSDLSTCPRCGAPVQVMPNPFAAIVPTKPWLVFCTRESTGDFDGCTWELTVSSTDGLAALIEEAGSAEAQAKYDNDPWLREQLARAMASPSVGRRRRST